MLCVDLDLSSSFLPEKLPEGDPKDFALPVFLQEPQDTYASKEAAATLSCKVSGKISFTYVLLKIFYVLLKIYYTFISYPRWRTPRKSSSCATTRG